jgi:hypothetical protein
MSCSYEKRFKQHVANFRVRLTYEQTVVRIAV